MARITRSTNGSPTKPASTTSTTVIEENHDPVRILIAPQCVSTQSRILKLTHPTDGSPKMFLFCAENGLFELKKTRTPSAEPRSVLFAPSHSQPTNEDGQRNTASLSFRNGFVNKDAELLTATPYDLAFVLLKSIAPQKTPTSRDLFQPLDDLLDSPEIGDISLQYILKNGGTIVQEAMSRICAVVEAGDESMFRYDEGKVFQMVLEKAHRVAESGLPASLEDRFVTRVLEAPVLSIRREETTSTTTTSQPSILDEAVSQEGSLDSQSTTTSTTPSVTISEVSTTSTLLTIPDGSTPVEIQHLQRVKVAYDFIAASCLPPYIANRLAGRLSDSTSPIDFKPLQQHLKNLAVLRAEATASRSMSDFSRKRGLEDDEIAEERAEKKRKQEEEEKRKKANESRGVRDLKKVNVTGMKKMSDFFTKKAVTTRVKS